MKKLIIFILIFVMCGFVFNKSIIKANTQVNNTLGYDSSFLYNETNTYQYDRKTEQKNYIDNKRNNETKNVVTQLYDMSNKNRNTVSNDDPLLTVITHGLGGDASHWSLNNGEFTYCDDSIVKRLDNIVNGGVNVYWYKVGNNKELKIYDVTEKLTTVNNQVLNINNTSNLTEIQNITDISKPIIILFESENTDDFNEIVYEDLNFAVSRAVYDIKQLNNQVLPKINLIGHSRGGLTNLQYALEHPDLVESLYSIGTPYIGSSSVLVHYILPSEITSWLKFCDGEPDIIDEEIYMDYYNRWNNNYDSLYKNINVYAFGGYSTMSFLNYIFKDALEEDSGIESLLVDAAFFYLELLERLYHSFRNFLNEYWLTEMLGNWVDEYIKDQSFDSGVAALMEILTNEINFEGNSNELVFKNDGFVDLESQLGEKKVNNSLTLSYKGFNRISVKFTESNCDINKCAMNSISIVHNLETRDDRIISHIISKINIKNKISGNFEVYDLGDNTVGIKTFLGDYNSSTLEIPSIINGKVVVEIGKYSFANNFYGNNLIESIILPNTLVCVKDYAFENCKTLEDVIVSNDCQLEKLKDYAFYDCENLNYFELPETITDVGENVFLNCNKLTQYGYNNYYLYDLGSINCRSGEFNDSHYLSNGYSMFLSFELECLTRYDFTIESYNQINIALYDDDLNVIMDEPVSIKNGKNESIVKELSAGRYFLKIDFVNQECQGDIDISLDSYFDNIESLTVNNEQDVLEHLHDNKNKFTFMKNTSGFYQIRLNGMSDEDIYYSPGTITILEPNGEIYEKFNISEFNSQNAAQNIEYADNLIFYAEAYTTYDIIVEFEILNFYSLDIVVTEINKDNMENLGDYSDNTNVVFGDYLLELNVNCIGDYNFHVEYINGQTENLIFVVYKEDDEGLVLLEYMQLDEYNVFDYDFKFHENDTIYFGYFNGKGVGYLSININSYVSNRFTLIVDPNENTLVGSEITLNNGEYNGLTITQGFTRICYLGSDAPNRTSRTLYNWYSSDENIARVSAYGTVTATALWTDGAEYKTVKITAVYKENTQIIGELEFTIYKSVDSIVKYLNYGMDVRVGGTTSGTEVTTGLGNEIPVSFNPLVTMHISKTRLICLGSDSPTTSIQDFIWSSSDLNIASVSIFGTITSHRVGNVTIYGVYKYNNNFRVSIEINVIN